MSIIADFLNPYYTHRGNDKVAKMNVSSRTVVLINVFAAVGLFTLISMRFGWFIWCSDFARSTYCQRNQLSDSTQDLSHTLRVYDIILNIYFFLLASTLKWVENIPLLSSIQTAYWFKRNLVFTFFYHEYFIRAGVYKCFILSRNNVNIKDGVKYMHGRMFATSLMTLPHWNCKPCPGYLAHLSCKTDNYRPLNTSERLNFYSPSLEYFHLISIDSSLQQNNLYHHTCYYPEDLSSYNSTILFSTVHQ